MDRLRLGNFSKIICPLNGEWEGGKFDEIKLIEVYAILLSSGEFPIP